MYPSDLKSTNLFHLILYKTITFGVENATQRGGGTKVPRKFIYMLNHLFFFNKPFYFLLISQVASHPLRTVQLFLVVITFAFYSLELLNCPFCCVLRGIDSRNSRIAGCSVRCQCLYGLHSCVAEGCGLLLDNLQSATVS